jgi:tetratricopeptide (TPR) repeat protein
MEKLILLIILFVSFSCATKEQKKLNYTIEMENALFRSQSNVDKLVKSKDPVFANSFNAACLENWDKEVTSLKLKLKQANSSKARSSNWYQLGNCYLLVENFERSLHYYDLYLSSGDSNGSRQSKVLQNIGQIYEARGLTGMAKSFYKKSLKYNTHNTQTKYLLGLNSLRNGNYRLAVKYFSQLMSIYPSSKEIKYSLGVSFYLSGSDSALVSKVISKLNEKDKGSIVFNISLKLKKNDASEDMIADLREIEFDFALMNDFTNIIKKRFEI